MIEELGKKKVWTQKYPDKGISGVMANQTVWQAGLNTNSNSNEKTNNNQTEVSMLEKMNYKKWIKMTFLFIITQQTSIMLGMYLTEQGQTLKWLTLVLISETYENE